MNEKELEAKAVEKIHARILADGPPEPVIMSGHNEAGWNQDLLYTLSEHELHVLGRGADIVVFFDYGGKVIGWRDDGRKGTAKPSWVDRGAFLKAVMDELGLPEDTRLGSLEPVELPPVGWTHQAVLFLAPVQQSDQVLRIWASPENLRVIQCLYGPSSEGVKSD
jgi:hypothetical protein